MECPRNYSSTLFSLPMASRDLILAISTDLTERMNRLLTSGHIAAIDVIPIAKDMLDLSTLRCLIAEKKKQQRRQLDILRQQRRGRAPSITTLAIAAAPTWEEMDDHVCATSRAACGGGGETMDCRAKRSRERKERRVAVRKFLRRNRNEEEESDEPIIKCRCSRALDLMDLEGDILRSFPDDAGDTLVAPELAQWAIAQLQVEAEQTRDFVNALLWTDDGESESDIITLNGSARVDSLEPEEEGSLMSKKSTSPSKSSSGCSSSKSSSSLSTPSRRVVRGWWKSDLDDEGDVEGDETWLGEERPDQRSGTIYPIRLRERRRRRTERVVSVLRKLSLA